MEDTAASNFGVENLTHSLYQFLNIDAAPGTVDAWTVSYPLVSSGQTQQHRGIHPIKKKEKVSDANNTEEALIITERPPRWRAELLLLLLAARPPLQLVRSLKAIISPLTAEWTGSSRDEPHRRCSLRSRLLSGAPMNAGTHAKFSLRRADKVSPLGWRRGSVSSSVFILLSAVKRSPLEAAACLPVQV